jgi:hypothetical protein
MGMIIAVIGLVSCRMSVRHSRVIVVNVMFSRAFSGIVRAFGDVYADGL